jgi:hypothetical protein
VLGTQNRKQRSLPRGTGVRFKSARDATKIQAFHHNRRIELSRWREIPATSSLLEIGSGWSGEEKEAAGVDTPLLQRMRRSGGEELETRKEGKRLRCERKGGVGRDGSRDAAAARRGRSEGLTCNKLVAFWTQKESDGSKRNETKRNEEDEPADTHTHPPPHFLFLHLRLPPFRFTVLVFSFPETQSPLHVDSSKQKKVNDI